MENRRLHFFGMIVSLMLTLYGVESAAVPPHPDVYETSGGRGISSAGQSLLDMAESPSSRTTGAALGTQEIVVILVEFPDVPHDPAHDSAYFDDLFFSESNQHSMYNYYHEASYGQTSISGTITGWYCSSHDMSYYGADGDKIDMLNGFVYELAREAAQLADAAGFDFSPYDKNGDGDIDHIIVVHAGPGQETGGRSYGPNAIWSHHWSIWSPDQVDGVRAFDYSMVAEFSPMGTAAHEFGHDLGLPDLYDTDGGSAGIGAWGIMASGAWQSDGNVPAHFCAWSKVFLGWVEPKVVTADEIGFTLNCVENGNFDTIVKVPLTANEYFLMENRHKTGFDQYLPGEGLLIWHIDDLAGNIVYNNVNDNENHKRVDLEEADGRTDLDGNANYGDDTDPYYLDNSAEFGDSTVPNSQLYSGDNSDVRVINISNPATTMTFDILLSENVTPVATEEMTINLAAGWNLISLYLQPINADCASVLSSVEGKYDSIWTYDAAARQWRRYVVGALSPLNDLNELEACVGYWIMMNQPGTLVVQGTPTATTISLKTGWNLVGYNSQTPMPIEDYLYTIEGGRNAILTYDPEAGQWLRYDTNAPAFLNSLQYLEPGAGYWIETQQDCVWDVSRN